MTLNRVPQSFRVGFMPCRIYAAWNLTAHFLPHVAHVGGQVGLNSLLDEQRWNGDRGCRLNGVGQQRAISIVLKL